jgi:hypothetical protein
VVSSTWITDPSNYNTAAESTPHGGAGSFMSLLYSTYSMDPYCLNVIFIPLDNCTPDPTYGWTWHGQGEAYSIPIRTGQPGVLVIRNAGDAYRFSLTNYNISGSVAGAINHEVMHCLGLYHNFDLLFGTYPNYHSQCTDAFNLQGMEVDVAELAE